MKQDKAFYKKLGVPSGWRWWGFVDGLHNFSKRVDGGFYNVRVSEKDIEDGSYLQLLDKLYTR